MKTALKLLFALVMVGAMAFVAVMAAEGAKEGQAAVDAWADRVRAGQPLGAEVESNETESLTALLRASATTSFRNFLSQSDTTCFWVVLDDPAHTELRVVLREAKGQQFVTAASAVRECDCPDDAAEPCHLQ